MEPAAAHVLVIVVSAVAGLVIGSFLNVVIYRLPRGQSVVAPASRCPSCGTPLRGLDNIPVLSWMVLRGRCRYCQAPISARYPAIELLTGAVFTALAIGLPGAAPLPSLDALVATTIALGAIDLEGEGFPAVLGWVALASSGTLVAVAVAADDPRRLTWAAVGGALALGAAVLDAVLVGASQPSGLPGVAAGIAWGWAAGWLALGAGIADGTVLVLLVLVSRSRSGRRLPVGALGAMATIGALLGGSFAAR